MTFIKIYFLAIAIIFLSSGCGKDFLNQPPQNILTTESVFSNTSSVEAYIVTLYNDLPIEDFSYGGGFNSRWPSMNARPCNYADESITCLADYQPGIGSGSSFSWWAYGAIRNVNNFIANIRSSTKFTKDQIDEWVGEALFIRAYYYFGMVKRYGGIPLITTVQDPLASISTLQLPRSKEQEIYDFIGQQLDSAAILLPTSSSESGRVNRYVAWALKSRAMLFAGSIAKYGSVQLNGVVGIPASQASTYFQASYDASAKIMDGTYSLYNKYADKAQNFNSLFLDQTDNPEVIFAKNFIYQLKGHQWDLYNLPFGVRSSFGYSSRTNPSYQLAEAYEYTDGSTGTLKLNDANGNPIEYSSALDLFKNKDPRFFATFIPPFGVWQTQYDPAVTIDVQAGIIDGTQVITSAPNNTYKGHEVMGSNGFGLTEGTQTGFYVRKFLNPAYARSSVKLWTSFTQWIDFRYGEILLNYSEAAFELGKTADALGAINQIRTRAGIVNLDNSTLTMDRIRHERQVEMAFENQRYWDLRRWRIADVVINNLPNYSLQPYYVLQDNKYIFKKSTVGIAKTFPIQLYYEMINTRDINQNPQLVQNPNY